MAIIVLAADVAAKIAAGEVVERPVSVIKELVENALDAQATDIRVEIREGGQRLMRVADNGLGIPSAEVETAFQRHATSKVREADDLFRIRTLGFRGEALPSIAAVSRVTLVTRTRDETVGTRLRIEGGRIVERASVGAPAGTVFTVENLFFNTPARLKFLKSATAEAGQIHILLQHLALAYPDRRFALVNDGRTIFQHTGGALRDSLTTIYGVDIGRQMIEVVGETEVDRETERQAYKETGLQGDKEARAAEDMADGLEDGWTPSLAADLSVSLSTNLSIAVQGFISPPAISRANRAHMTFIVNGRWVQDRSLIYAVTEAYHTLLMVGRFPVTVLHLTLAPDELDVNVHPAKSEVRFRDSRAVFSLVQQSVRQALLRHAPIPQFGGSPQWGEGQRGESGSWMVEGEVSSGPAWWMVDDTPSSPDTALTRATELGAAGEANGAERTGQPLEPALPLNTPAHKLPMLRVLGQVAQSYIIAEGPDGLYLIDQHAAHERVLYEEFLQAHARAEVGRQALLAPMPLELGPSEAAILAEQNDILDALGFSLEPFGPQTILVRAVPTIIKQADPRSAVRDILAQVGEGRRNPLEIDIEAALLRAVCKTAAIKAGQTLSMAEMQALLSQLEASSSPRTCPHGRPTMIHLSAGFLAREFGRLG